jgi:alkylation response protein AidB-like acyl-CoA dehydrogenase
MESVEEFRTRARAWLAENMPRDDPDAPMPAPGDDDELWLRARELQRTLHAGGFAGICFPVEYGGLGLTPAHQRAFTEEADGYEMPLMLNTPTFTICAATLLDCGSEQQKRDRIGAAIRGEEVLIQFLSEPSGGSDLAGLLTRAEFDGQNWILNGAKTWSTSAYAGDWALCLARTDPEVPKHAGLTMFLVPTKAPGLTMNRIRMVNGSTEFCEEFFDDVVLPADAVVGEVNDGWRVASRQLYHERSAVGGGSPYASGRGRSRTVPQKTPQQAARAAGRTDDPAVRELVGEWLALSTVHQQLNDRVAKAMAAGHPATTGGRADAADVRRAGEPHPGPEPAHPRRRGRVRRRRRARAGRHGRFRVPHAAEFQPGRRQHRDVAQPGRRAAARAAPGAGRGQGCAVQPGQARTWLTRKDSAPDRVTTAVPMSSLLSRILGVVGLLVVLAACTAAEEPGLPSLAEVAAARSASAPPPAGAPGPPVTDACPLLSSDEVTRALGRPARAAGGQEIDSFPAAPAGHGFLCNYGPGEAGVSLLVGIAPAADYTPAAGRRPQHRHLRGRPGAAHRPG